MRKRAKLCLLFLLALLLSGCGQQGTPDTGSSGQGKIRVVSTIFPLYDFTRQVAGEKAELVMLLPPGSESHSYEPSPKDTLIIQNCDVFIYVGGESDAWVNRILESMDTSQMKIVSLMDCVNAVEEEIVAGMQAESEESVDGDEQEAAAYDEHIWTSPPNAKRMVQKISDALGSVDPANAEAYQVSTAAYLAKLDELDNRFQEVVKQSARKTIVFGDRFPFRYFADAYGLDYYAAFPGCSSESEPSAKTVSFLIDKVKEEQIPVVFHLELSNEKMADTICEATGAKKALFHSAHNLSKAELEQGVTYLDLMTHNVEALKEALR